MWKIYWKLGILKHQMIIISTCFYIKMDNHTSIFTLKADCPGMFLLDDPLPHPSRLLHLQDEDVAADADLDTGISIKLAGHCSSHRPAAGSRTCAQPRCFHPPMLSSV